VQFIVNTGIPELPDRPALPSDTIDGEIVEND
jgi:hypothetical protein